MTLPAERRDEMLTTLEQVAVLETWPRSLVNVLDGRMPDDYILSGWGPLAGVLFARWSQCPMPLGGKRLESYLKVHEARRLITRHPGFHDFDLPVRITAATGVDTIFGCRSRILLDAALGLHVSNSGLVYPMMKYGRHGAALTYQCLQGHRGHTKGWIVPPDVRVQAEDKIIASIGRAVESEDEPISATFRYLESRVR